MFGIIRCFCDVISLSLFVLINCAILLHFIKWFFALLHRWSKSGQKAGQQAGYVLVTGCDSGFGYNSALELGARGVHVFAGCLTQDGVTQLTQVR